MKVKYISIMAFALFLFTCRSEKSKHVSKPIPDSTKTEVIALSPDSTKENPQEALKKNLPKIDYDTTEWAEILLEKDSIYVDMKYAGTDNFVEEQMYECSRCLLRPEVALALLKAQKNISRKGYKLKVLDCYRPRPVQQKLWDKVPNASYVTPPKKGSMHNRGTAVDLTIVDAQGNELDMGTKFDYFGKEAHHDYYDLPEQVLANRELLKQTMRKAGFLPIRTEWWHYYFAKGAPKSHELSDYEWSCDPDKHGI